MSFASATYLPYLLLVLVGFQFLPARLRATGLLVASYAFYADWRLDHLPLLAVCTLTAYLTALGMGRITERRRRRPWLIASIAVNLGLLVVFKYSGFIVDTIRGFTAVAGLEGPDRVSIELPLGISFYTFQALSYSIDVYRGRSEPCRNLVDFATYVSFFPQLIAGPIERADHLLPQLQRTRRLTLADLSIGARLILWGLIKKQVISDNLRAFASPAFFDPESAATVELAIIAAVMIVMLYCDFSGYTDIARGSARFFGVDLVKNFERPFMATSLLGVWRRWHISFWTWIIDYVYLPLTRRRQSRARMLGNTVLVLTLVGLWHGASWSFAVWGIVNGVLVFASQLVRPKRRGREARATRLTTLVAWSVTMCQCAILMVLFYMPDLATAGDYLARMLVPGLAERFLPSGNDAWLALAIVAGCLGVHSLGEFRDLGAAWERIGKAGRTLYFVGLFVFWIALRVPESPAFVYFRF